MNIIAIDPGDVHVGVATRIGPGKEILATEVDADKAIEFVEELLRVIDDPVLVVEEFVLYPGLALEQSWSPMATAEMIGVIKYLARTREVPIVMQGAQIKKPIKKQCRARKIDCSHSSIHAEDAKLHLIYYMLRHGLGAEEAK